MNIKLRHIICKIFGHRWTGKKATNVAIMQFWTGHNEGCIRCGELK